MKTHDVVILGTSHSRTNATEMICDLLPLLPSVGVKLIGLEISSDQQWALHEFVQNGRGLGRVDISAIIDSPAYREMLNCIRKTGLDPVALDLPRAHWASSVSRDRWMSENITRSLRENPQAKMLVVVGNLHALKNVRWADPRNKHVFVAGCLHRYKQYRVCSVLTEHADRGSGHSVSSLLPKGKKPFAVETSKLRASLRIQKIIAARQMEPHELADGVIVF